MKTKSSNTSPDSEEAIITKNLSNPTIVKWAKDQDSFLISIGAPVANLNPDLVVATNRNEARGNDFKLLRQNQFNRQQSWYKAGNKLREWDGSGPFHLGNLLVMATWICGKRGFEGITFLNFSAESAIGSEYDRRTFRDVMKTLIEEFGFGVRYTDPQSNLFAQLGATQIEPDPQPEPPESIEIPKTQKLFDNQNFSAPPKETSVKIQSGPLGVIAKLMETGKEYIVTERVSEAHAGANPSNLLLTYPANEAAVKRAVELCEGRHDIHLLAYETKNRIYGLKRERGLENISLQATAFLSFAIGHDPEYLKTEGIIENLNRKERRFIRGLSKGENIEHV